MVAIRLADRLGPDASVVTLMADSGLKYLSTDVNGADTRQSRLTNLEIRWSDV